MLAACEERRTVRPEPPETVMRAPGVEPDDVTRRQAGQVVRVAGGVEEMLTDRAFLLGDTDLFEEASVPVVARDPVMLAGIPLADRHAVVVSGIVRKNIADAERDLGRELPANVERAIGDGPVIVAEAVWRRGDPHGWTNQ